MKILILGERGWLGSRFRNYVEATGTELVYTNMNINSLGSIHVYGQGITDIVNFAASASIDWCEKNKQVTFSNNVLGAINVAEVCKKEGIKYTFISSACIFQSKDERDVQYEDSTPRPGCFYTETKLMAERLIKEITPDAIIARLRLPISEIPHPRNALNKLASYSKLVNTKESATVIEDFLDVLFNLIARKQSGDYNLVNEGIVSPAILGKMLGSKFDVISKEELDRDMASQGRAHRVSTVAASKKITMPPINEKIESIINKWKTLSV